MIINTKYGFGPIVYLRTDKEQLPRIVTRMQISPNMTVTYELSCGTESSWHFDIEISEERDALMAVS
jgi:hypothetical protein